MGNRVLFLTFWLAVTACGAKSELAEREAIPRPPECITDRDCDDGLFCTGTETCLEGRCVPGAPVVCMDGDPCTEDLCNESTRGCTYRPYTRDNDGDGHRNIRDGFRAGQPEACGDDCDDDNAMVYPGATEVCNGRDDNCNGVIDDNATFTPVGNDVRVSEPSTAPSGPGGLAWSGERYLTTYWGYSQGNAHVYFSALDRAGNHVSMPPQRQITLTPSDAFGAAVAWTGRELGIVWQDRRDGDYEIYFNRLTPDGEKLGPDQRITFAPGFSINPSITWTGSEFLVAWQDERDARNSGGYEIYVQRIDRDGRQIEDNLRITFDPANSESPVIAAGGGSVAIVWLDGRGGMRNDPVGSRGIWFATFTSDMRRTSADQRITPRGWNPVAPTLAWNRDRWVIAWHDAAADSADHEIWGTTRNVGGVEITPPRKLTSDPGFSRYPSLVPLGDRVLLVWADDRAGAGYDVWARMLDASLSPLTPEVRVTRASGDSVYPIATIGPEGDVGILFRDQRESRWQVHFTRLQCAIGR